MPNWTTQQLDAIEGRDRSIIVSAAAGSGKTAVLVERLVRILSETAEDRRISADRMTVVTFTKDAAAQMKQRLAASLSAKIAEVSDAGDEAAHDYLLEQRMRLSSAKISTIHSFCFDLIRENADVLGISPQFTILEPGQEAIYSKRAVDKVMERWTSEEERMGLLFDSFCAKDDADLEELVFAIAENLQSLAFPKLWMQNARNIAKNPTDLFEKIRSATVNEIREIIAFYEGAEPFADASLTEPDPKKGNGFRTVFDADLIELRAYADFLESAEQQVVCADPFYHFPDFPKFPSLRKNVDVEQKAKFKQYRQMMRDQFDNVTKRLVTPLRFFDEDASLSAKLIPALLDLTQEYLDELLAEKTAQNVLGFSDAEELTLRLLASFDENGKLMRTPLASELSDQFDLLMIDEYQDSNNKQDCIFKLLSHGCRIDGNSLYYGDNAFLVGDVKQSIYSFRQANPENFRNVIAEAKPLHDTQPGEMALVFLNQNFRSAHGVLDFVNALCFAVMTEQCGEVQYTLDEQLNFGSPVFGEYSGKTQFILAREGEELPEGSDLQSECIADTIYRMVEVEHTPVVTLQADGSHSTRPATYGDFAILLRSTSKHSGGMIDALQRRSIPFSADQDGGLLALPEIDLARSLLRSIDNSLHDGALAGVLLSPIYGFNASDLAQLKLYSKRRRYFLKMQALAEDEGAPTELQALRTRCQDFLSDLHAMQETTVRLPLEEAIWEIYRQTDLLSLQNLYDDANQKRANLEAFARAAKGYREHADITAESCLTGWLRHLDRLEDAGRDLELGSSCLRSDAVSIKTIHKSKGLQYPFVFVAHLEEKFSTKPSFQRLHTAPDGTVGLKINDRNSYTKSNTVSYEYLLHGFYKRQKSEELRLLYVALTRAEQQLFIVAEEKSFENFAETSAIYADDPHLAAVTAPMAGCMLDWVTSFLLCSKDAEHFRRLIDGEVSVGELADFRQWQFDCNLQSVTARSPVLTQAADEVALTKMRRQIAINHVTEQSSLVSKYSVTQLAHPDTVAADLMRRPQFTLEGKTGGLANLLGAARGTAVHKIMQYLDFELAERDPVGAVNKLLETGTIDQAEAKSITPEKLSAFFRSPLYQRIAKALTVERERKLFVEIGALKLPNHSEIIERYQGTDGVLIGTMDLLFREPDGWVIVDYKTDYTTSGAALLKEYALQLELYRAAAAYILQDPIKALYLYSFALDKELSVD